MQNVWGKKSKIEHPRIVGQQFQRHNLCLIGIAEVKERENEAEEIFEVVMASNFPELFVSVTDTLSHI